MLFMPYALGHAALNVTRGHIGRATGTGTRGALCTLPRRNARGVLFAEKRRDAFHAGGVDLGDLALRRRFRWSRALKARRLGLPREWRKDWRQLLKHYTPAALDDRP
jgi:hypothetical protein